MLDKLKAYFMGEAFKNLAARAGWTALYVLLGAGLAVLTTSDKDLTGAAVRAAVIAAVLAAGKAVLVGRFGDPDKIRTRLGEIANRVAHTAWQAAIASVLALLSTNQLGDAAAIKATVIAALVNVLKTIVIPPDVPGDEGGDEVAPGQDGTVGDHEVPQVDGTD